VGSFANLKGKNMGRKHSSIYILIGAVAVFSLILVGNGRLRGQMAGTSVTSATEPNSYIFQLELDGAVVAEYTECSGLGSGNDIQENVVAGNAGAAVIHKTPGALRWPNITLRRNGLSGANVWSWREAMVVGNSDAAVRDGAVVMLETGSLEPLARWQFRRGWVASLTLEGSVEELTIVHEGLERVATSSTQSGIRPR
jgi:phage tail-like protein